MREEFLFYGVAKTQRPTLFCMVDDESDDENAAREAVLSVLRKSRIQVPGLTSRDIESRDAVERITEPVGLFKVAPPVCWKLEIFLERETATGSRQEHTVSSRSGFAVIPDERNHTLEFRILRWGDITKITSEIVTPTASTMQIGQLRGIADGDGYNRIPFVMTGEALIKYGQQVGAANADELRSVLRRSQLEPLEVLAVGDGFDGRFTQFQTRLPFLFTTTSVDFLLENLAAILA
jgi:hypothetical protein